MVNHPPTDAGFLGTTIAWRALAGMGCASLAGGLGLVQPFVWYLVWWPRYPNLYGHEYQQLVPWILAISGVMGGGIAGLIAGMTAPSRAGLVLSFLGLGLVHIATGLYLWSFPEATMVAFLSILIPAIVVDFVVAAACWFGLPERALYKND
jgi:hypothetical protein